MNISLKNSLKRNKRNSTQSKNKKTSIKKWNKNQNGEPPQKESKTSEVQSKKEKQKGSHD